MKLRIMIINDFMSPISNNVQEIVEVYDNLEEAENKYLELLEQDKKSGGYSFTTIKLCVIANNQLEERIKKLEDNNGI